MTHPGLFVFFFFSECWCVWGVPEPRDNTREMAVEILIIALYLENQAPRPRFDIARHHRWLMYMWLFPFPHKELLHLAQPAHPIFRLRTLIY